jgi:hypothetical protein
MKLEAARSLVDSWFAIGPQGNHSKAPTGEYYIEIVSGGFRLYEAEHQPCGASCLSEETAVDLWLQAVRDYAADKSGTLYWRIPPEMGEVMLLQVKDNGERFTMARDGFVIKPYRYYRVYSRLLISDKPQIMPACIEKAAVA